MKLTEHIYLIGSGAVGISHPGDCNVYAVESNGVAALIDCGLCPDPEVLLQNLELDGVPRSSVRYLFLTHAHTDHVAALPALQAMGITVCASKVTTEIMGMGFQAFYHVEHPEKDPFETFLCNMAEGDIDRPLADGDTVSIGDLTIQAVAAPAHTPDSMCFLLRSGGKRYLFSGDTLFYQGQINYFGDGLSQPECYPEVIERLASLDVDGLLPGHILFTLAGAQTHVEKALAAIRQGRLPEKKPYS